ncbi:MAG: hypothetical protein KAI45_00015 [Melioribacteraceae bacterium]|nr:hypothetical protein [Melioribacteraceae bacterium]
MKTIISSILILLLLSVILINCTEDNPVETPELTPSDSPNMTLFDKVIFYDGYAEKVNENHHSGILRVSNSVYVTKLSPDEIGAIGDNLTLEIIIGAACDNYDRIGNVFLSLFRKGDPYFNDLLVSKIEIARFITPFMNKNNSPREVPYNFEINNIAKILNDSNISSKYDFWIEFSVFGVPYAAQSEVPGCAGRNDCFLGTLKLISTDKASNIISQHLIPIATFASLNNSNHSDVPGQTIRTFDVDITSTITNAKMYLITSNHGSNSGGEEYIRRDHYIYFDENLIDTYKPGGKSCEPYRIFNTQGNGIYSSTPRTVADWTSWNNWCPGDKIPIRIYELGNLTVGNHKFRIDVPDAEFAEGQGNIPLSIYIQGDI